jgi:SAM-dependent methyltransferase
MEPFYPLHVFVCEECFLVQLEEFVSPEEIFSEYAYFSSYSDSWLKHAEQYVNMITGRLDLGRESLVVEVASNDGYLLQYFLKKGIPNLGIEPAANVAEAAVEKGVRTIVEFFGEDSAGKLAEEGSHADLIIGNNVLAQVPDINDFVQGMQVLLKPEGVITMEFPHLIKLMEENQFDTIYHEHFSYFSLYSVEKIMQAHGLEVFDVDQIPTHGGSLRIYACHRDNSAILTSSRVEDLRKQEARAGINDPGSYDAFEEQVKETKRKLLEFLIEIKRKGKTVAGYGAPGKGNTLLNYCGIREDFLDYTVDRNPYKQGKYLPGTHVPIFSPEKIRETKPDFVMILPWNFKDEIMEQNAFIREWGGQFFVPIPEVRVYE